MTTESFIDKFNSKSNDELEVIANNPRVYVLEARHAAATILKNRNVKLPIIEKIQEEVNHLSEQFEKEEELQAIIEQRLWDRLKSLEIGSTTIYKLDNKNELKLKRVSDSKFRIKIEDNYMSFLFPILICVLRGKKEKIYFPFFDLTTLLFWGLGGSIVFFTLSMLDQIEFSFQLIIMPIAFIGGLQIFLMPMVYFTIKSELKKELGIKRVLTPHKK